MRIVEIVSGHSLNGAMKHAFTLARELSRRGHDVMLVCREESWIARQATRENLDVCVSDLHRWPPDELRRISERISDRAADIVHTHMSRAHFFGVLLRMMIRTPVVATAHSRRIQPHWRFNDRIIACSEAGKRFQIRWNFVPRDRVDVVHNFVDPEEFAAPGPEYRAAARRAVGLNGSAPIIGIVGSVFREKRVHDIVGALPGIVNAMPEAQLAIVGDGPVCYRRRLEQEIEQLGIGGHVVWLGHGERMVTVMAALDLLVSLSTDEALTLAVLEAMAMEVPVIASDCGGIRECLRDGVSGLLIPPRDVAALTSACVTILQNRDLGRRLGSASRTRVLANFAIGNQVTKIESIFKTAAAETPAAASIA